MKILLVSAAFAATAFAPVAATAQALPGAVIAVVDIERVTNDCTACKTASTALRGQIAALQNRQNALATPLDAEQKSIQTAVDALKGNAPDAALQARIKAFQTKQQQGAQELTNQQDQIKRNQQYISKQISDKIGPVYQSVMQKRGANIMMDVGATLATTTAVDITNDVLAGLNAALTTIDATAPAAAQQPQGR